jgi:hypothetical protein
MGLSYGISCQGTLMWESLVMGMTVGRVGCLGTGHGSCSYFHNRERRHKRRIE